VSVTIGSETLVNKKIQVYKHIYKA